MSPGKDDDVAECAVVVEAGSEDGRSSDLSRTAFLAFFLFPERNSLLPTLPLFPTGLFPSPPVLCCATVEKHTSGKLRQWLS